MKLENERLTVEFAQTGGIETQRFDRTAMVSQVLLDGKYRFCTPEQVIPGRRSTQGTGLCGEFVLESAEEAKAGEWFTKPGVGLLRQTADYQPYDIWKTYELRAFPVEVRCTDGRVLFRQKTVPCGGYGVDIEKAFCLAGSSLVLDISVRNAGERECCLKEYQHNFLSLGGMPVSEGYVLELGCDKELAQIEQKTLRQGDEIRLPSAVRVQGNKVLWEKDMNGCVLYHRSEEVDQQAPHRWKLYHAHSSLSVMEETGFSPSRIDVWAVEHCICTEFYHTVHLSPGETAHWRRVWTFDA